MQKVNQVEQDLGAAGYLKLQGSQEASDRGTASTRAQQKLRAKPTRTPSQSARDAALAKQMQMQKNEANTRFPVAPMRPGYLAPQKVKMKHRGKTLMISPADVTDEFGRPVTMPAMPMPKGMIKAGPGDVTNEYGEPVDKKSKKGKKVGYLADPNMRTGERRRSDQLFDRDRGLLTADPLGVDAMRQEFGEHAKAMTYDSRSGAMQFPPGYFEGMTDEQRQYIMNGVKHLQTYDRGVAI